MRQSRIASKSAAALSSIGGDGVGRGEEDTGTITLAYVLENDPALLPGVIRQLVEAAARLRLFDEVTAERVALALYEAMINAIEHGNLELDSSLKQGDESAYQLLADVRRRMLPYRRRRLRVCARLGSTRAVFVIADQGRGFDPARLPDPTDPECCERPSGRGLLMIRSYMDAVSFNPAGNEVTLVKGRGRGREATKAPA